MADLGFKDIGVIGGGQMGAGIAQVLATYGAQVKVFDISKEQIEKAKKSIQKSLGKLEEKKKIHESPSTIFERMQFCSEMKPLSSSELVIEAATERFEIKEKIFRELDSVVNDEAILGSNTSSISITKLAALTKRPEQFVGIHFMNPVPLMKLVEVIAGLKTSKECLERVEKLIQGIEKVSSHSKDYPGFVVNRILMPMINEAVYALYEGVGTKEDIDNGMKLGTNQPMGPLQLADFIGLDTCLSIMEVLYEGLGDSKYRPCPLLRNHVLAGMYGRKSGEGFYKYE